VKRLCRRGGHLRLLPENPCFQPIEFKDGQELVVWGVVTSFIHRFE
jgi:DNA polymerase V